MSHQSAEKILGIIYQIKSTISSQSSEFHFKQVYNVQAISTVFKPVGEAEKSGGKPAKNKCQTFHTSLGISSHVILGPKLTKLAQNGTKIGTF